MSDEKIRLAGFIDDMLGDNHITDSEALALLRDLAALAPSVGTPPEPSEALPEPRDDGTRDWSGQAERQRLALAIVNIEAEARNMELSSAGARQRILRICERAQGKT